MRFMVCFILFAGFCCPLRGQHVEKVYPKGENDPLFGVVATLDGILYSAGVNNTFLRSTDSGNTWEQLSTGEHRFHIAQLVTDGTDLYMIATPYLHSGRPEVLPGEDPFALYKYKTHSNTVLPLSVHIPERTDSSKIIYYSLAATSDALYLSYSWDERGILVSKDSGTTWSKLVTPDSLGERYSCQLYTKPDANDIVVVGGGMEKIYAIGRNGGESWEQIAGPLAESIGLGRSAILYLGEGRFLVRERDTGALLTNGQSAEWSVVSYPPMERIAACAVSPSGTIVFCSDKGGIFSSEDDGATWTTIHPDFKTLYRLEYDLGFFGSNGIVAVNSMGEIYITNDMGVSWDIPRKTPFVVSSLLRAENDNAVISVMDWKTREIAIYKTTDGFASFDLVLVDDFPGYSIRPASTRLWYGLARRGGDSDTLIYRSEDAGESWHAVYVDTDARLLNAKVETYDSERAAVAMTKGLLYTSDGGSTWSWIQRAEWSANYEPVDIGISPYDGAIWYTLHDSTGTYKVVRSSPDFREWHVVLELSKEERQRVYHISRIRPLNTGEVLAVAVLKFASNAREKNILTMYSDDNGDSWQSYEMIRSSDDRETKKDAGATILANGGIITEYYVNRSKIQILSLYASTNYGRTDTLVFETSSVPGVDKAIAMYSDDAISVYYKQALSIHRIDFPEVTDVIPLTSPPLPLSVGSPYPHPVSKDAGSATLFIQSDKIAEVNMTVHNLAGRGLKVLYTGELGADGRYVTWDTGGLAPGTYLLQLASKKGVCRRKVVVVE
ncbi:MAG: hypothetical protein KFH87_14250 [Bacteroidetes bacterium]|nr:hypothetical protein [Bacteroidota bacterium]